MFACRRLCNRRWRRAAAPCRYRGSALTRLLLSLLSLLLIPGSAAGIAAAAVSIWQTPLLIWPLAGGFAAGALLYLLLIRRINWLTTLEHETTHAIAALLFLRRIHNFKVTLRRGGYITYSGRRSGTVGDLCITLAPYFLPTSTLPLAAARPLLAAVPWWFDSLIGVTVAYHLLSNAEELIRNWSGTPMLQAEGEGGGESDIKKGGYIFSLIFISGLGLFFFGVTAALVAGGGGGLLTFLHTVWSHAGNTLYALGTRLLQLIPR